VILIPGVGMFSFGKNKTEARITGEFYTNAIHVMEGASSLGHGELVIRSGDDVPQAGPAAPASKFSVCTNYVALPPSEAFRIEYWALEEAKIRRQPAEKELSRKVVLVVGGGSGIGREVARLAIERGAHVVVADRDTAGAERVVEELKKLAPSEFSLWTSVDISNRETIRKSLDAAVNAFGGIDILVNTAAMFPSSPDGLVSDAMWATTLSINVTANYLLTDEAAKLFKEQDLDVSVVLTSSANAVVSKRGSEAYDVSKAALSHLVRELAIGLSPRVRVNGISPATVVKGSTMFPRDRVRASLSKYNIPFEENLSDDELRTLLANFYAKRTLTHQPIDPVDCAEAILFLAGDRSRCTSGHLIPVDGGLPEAFLRCVRAGSLKIDERWWQSISALKVVASHSFDGVMASPRSKCFTESRMVPSIPAITCTGLWIESSLGSTRVCARPLQKLLKAFVRSPWMDGLSITSAWAKIRIPAAIPPRSRFMRPIATVTNAP
jgi:NAD(P)-dependent dehydrogenase (short-subunit alcohol dehydrogenase family)